MTKFLHFFSVALLTQFVLMISQLVLLPMQIRVWGHEATAQWYAALALANITTVVDFGLRTAGHAELVDHVKSQLGSSVAGDHFRQVWSWIRLLMVAITLLLVGGQCSYSVFWLHTSYAMWKAALIAAYALETVLIIRITYLDTLGFYRGAEASYFVFAALRLLFSVSAILVFHVEAYGLAFLFLLTSFAGVAIQGFMLCRGLDPLKLLSAFPRKLSLQVLLLSRLTVAEPFANWVRLNLPVVIIAAISSPSAVTTFVGLRAAFGAARTTIQQLARVASVECLRFRSDRRFKEADMLLSLFLLLAIAVGTTAAVFVIADNMRVIGLWLTGIDRKLFQSVTIAFVLSAPFYAYQIPLNLMFRLGELGGVARRHYLYAAYACVFALFAIKLVNFTTYLALLACSEIALSISFLTTSKQSASLSKQGCRGLMVCACGSFMALGLWLMVRLNVMPFFSLKSPIAGLNSFGVAVACLLFFLSFQLFSNPGSLQMLRRFVRKTEPVSAAAE